MKIYLQTTGGGVIPVTLVLLEKEEILKVREGKLSMTHSLWNTLLKSAQS